MKLSARNTLSGKIVSVTEGAVNSIVKIELPHPCTLTAVITNEAVKDLQLAPGKDACAIVKSSNVMIGTDD